ncbi:MAG: type I restriction enzyme HsdR N-terminal domain-containing protein [Bacteroidales bacterium]
MKELNLPEYSFKITGDPGSEMIFDQIRRKYVRLTPEEWVRQNFVEYLVREGKYPRSLIGIEVPITLNTMRRRVDILVHNRHGKPVMIVECKSPDVSLDEKVADQAMAYNMQLKVRYFIITNGVMNYAYRYGSGDVRPESVFVIPQYDELIADDLP